MGDGALTAAIKAQALGMGFDLVGITRTGPAETADHFEKWLSAGRAGTMAYLERQAPKRRDTRLPLDGAVSAIVVGLDYGGRQPEGPVARYARGDDYHDIMWARLDELLDWIRARAGRAVVGRSYVDTGPILERDLARRAGLGWFGKNTMLVNPRIGSFFFIGSLLVDLELAPDSPFEADRCGSCTRCIDACPTNAITAPRELDATRCISYLTIELRGDFPPATGHQLGDHLYGCDDCQTCCPWNVRFAREIPSHPALAARDHLRHRDAATLARELLDMTQEEFSERFRRSPMKRAKLHGLKRNAAAVLAAKGL